MPYQNIFIIAQNSPSIADCGTLLSGIGTCALAIIGFKGYKAWTANIFVKKIQSEALSNFAIIRRNLIACKEQIKPTNENQETSIKAMNKNLKSSFNISRNYYTKTVDLVAKHLAFFDKKINDFLEQHVLENELQNISNLFNRASLLVDTNKNKISISKDEYNKNNIELKGIFIKVDKKLELIIKKIKKLETYIRKSI